MHLTKISFFIDGLEEDGTAFEARTLSGPITDFASGATRIGHSLNGEILPSEKYLTYSMTLLPRVSNAIFLNTWVCLFPRATVTDEH